MRGLTASVLVMEAIVVGLAIPVALVVGGAPAGVAWLLAALALACLLLPAMARRPGYLAAGWLLQVAILATGFAVPMMFLLGAAFAALWVLAVRLGRRTSAAQAAPGRASPG